MIRSLAGEFSVKTLCRALSVSRSGYYPAQRKVERPRSAQRALGSEDQNELRGEPAHRRQSPARCGLASGRGDRRATPGGAAHARAAPARHAKAALPTSHHQQPSSLSHRSQPPGRAGGATRAARPGLAGGHHLCGHQRGLALRGGRAGGVFTPDRGLGGGRHDAHRADHPSLRAGDPNAAASTPATPTASCCAFTVQPRA